MDRIASVQDKEAIVNNAAASVEMEGFHVSPESRKLCLDYLNRELSKEELIKTILERSEMQCRIR